MPNEPVRPHYDYPRPRLQRSAALPSKTGRWAIFHRNAKSSRRSTRTLCRTMEGRAAIKRRPMYLDANGKEATPKPGVRPRLVPRKILAVPSSKKDAATPLDLNGNEILVP